jgi:hypothetical protein
MNVQIFWASTTFPVRLPKAVYGIIAVLICVTCAVPTNAHAQIQAHVV